VAETCHECSISGAVHTFKSICDAYKMDCAELDNLLESDDTTPQAWVDCLHRIRDRAEGEAREAFELVLSQLCEALEGSQYSCRK